MKRFEYHILSLDERDVPEAFDATSQGRFLATLLNDYGEDGWEVAGLNSHAPVADRTGNLLVVLKKEYTRPPRPVASPDRLDELLNELRVPAA